MACTISIVNRAQASGPLPLTGKSPQFLDDFGLFGALMSEQTRSGLQNDEGGLIFVG